MTQCFDKTHLRLEDIILKNELEKHYQFYPKGIVILFIKNGANTAEDMKRLIIKCENTNFKIRNLGSKKIDIAKNLIRKYENETFVSIDFTECRL